MVEASNYTFLIEFRNSSSKIIFSTYGNSSAEFAEMLKNDDRLRIEKVTYLDGRKFKRIKKDDFHRIIKYDAVLENELKRIKFL